MQGATFPQTKLWLIPLQTKNEKLAVPQRTLSKQQLNNLHHTTGQQQLIQYLHQCLFSPTKSTLIKAIKNNQLIGIPGLNEKAVNEHLPISTATIKGHMHR